MSEVRYKEFTKQFIALYKSLPSLWDMKSTVYYDRYQKKADYEIMVEKMREIDPEANRDMVRNKINSMRASRRKEASRIKQSIEAGGPMHEPKLWYYELMDFLDGEGLPQRSRWKSESPKNSYCKGAGIATIEYPERRSDSSNNSVDQLSSESSDVQIVATTRTNKPSKILRKRKLTRAEAEDEAGDAFGRYVGKKLKNLPQTQRIFLEKLINDAIFEAELGNLNRKCYVHVPPRELKVSVSDSD